MCYFRRAVWYGTAVLLTVLPGPANAGKVAPTHLLAWFALGKLDIGFLGGRFDTLASHRGNVFRPAYSHEGRYVAFLWQSPTPSPYGVSGAASLWLGRFCVHVPALPAPGCQPHRVSSIGHVISFSWSPTTDQLVALAGTGGNILLDARSGRTIKLPSNRNSSLPAWSPNGKSLAIELKSQRGYSRLVVIGPGRRSSRPFVGLARYALPILAGWWGSHDILYWVDPDGSVSLASDGMKLIDFDLQRGRVRNLGVMLGYQDWLAASGSRLLMVAGGGRSAFYGKHLELCRLHASCHSVPGLPRGRISYDPAWAPGGSKMAFIVARARHTFGTQSPAAYSSWLDSHEIWVATGDGSRAHALVLRCRGLACTPGGLRGVLRRSDDPEWISGGPGLLFERDGGLWLVRHLGAFNALPLAGMTKGGAPDSRNPAYQNWYYGHMDWHDLFAVN